MTTILQNMDESERAFLKLSKKKKEKLLAAEKAAQEKRDQTVA